MLGLPCHYLSVQRSVVALEPVSGMILTCIQILNVEVPFYFKSIVDSMNVDFAAVGGTATTVAGSMILACKDHQFARQLEYPG